MEFVWKLRRLQYGRYEHIVQDLFQSRCQTFIALMLRDRLYHLHHDNQTVWQCVYDANLVRSRRVKRLTRRRQHRRQPMKVLAGAVLCLVLSQAATDMCSGQRAASCITNMTMKAVIPEAGKCAIVQRSIPEPSAGQVLLKIHATALNRADTLQRGGKYPPPPGESDILGLECVGEAAPHWF
jgi:hypothetical protein